MLGMDHSRRIGGAVYTYRTDPRQLDLIEWIESYAKGEECEASGMGQDAGVPDLRGVGTGTSHDDRPAVSHGEEKRR